MRRAFLNLFHNQTPEKQSLLSNQKDEAKQKLKELAQKKEYLESCKQHLESRVTDCNKVLEQNTNEKRRFIEISDQLANEFDYPSKLQESAPIYIWELVEEFEKVASQDIVRNGMIIVERNRSTKIIDIIDITTRVNPILKHFNYAQYLWDIAELHIDQTHIEEFKQLLIQLYEKLEDFRNTLLYDPSDNSLSSIINDSKLEYANKLKLLSESYRAKFDERFEKNHQSLKMWQRQLDEKKQEINEIEQQQNRKSRKSF